MNTDFKDIDLIPIEKLNDSLISFYVPRYQRGYRWGKTEIELLLKDINDVESDQKYCLQPISVTWKENEKHWELIDGQQRMTTLYLLLSALGYEKDQLYMLTYDTRDTTHKFLGEIQSKTNQFLDKDLGEVKENWKELVEREKDIDNIDNFHLFQAFITICKWLEMLENRELFKRKLLENTHIIWHPIEIISHGQSAEDFFIKMNAGKIKLTSAELIKALFILQIENSEESWDMKTIKKKKLSNEWDYIENELSDDLFWFFINNEENENYETRIGKLFDLITGVKSKEPLASYLSYANGETPLNWKKVKHLFNRLKEWYDDIEYFHRIGFLINANFKSIDIILEETENKKKSTIEQMFNDWICNGLKLTRQKDNEQIFSYAIDNLNYEDKPQHCRVILLLYNVLLIEKQFPGQRFPFHFYNDPDLKWSLEHIHPQSAKDLESADDLKSMLDDYSYFIKENTEEQVEEDQELIKNFKKLKRSIGTSNSINEKKELFKNFIEEYKDKFELHSIGNLALLDKNSNSKLSNKSFLSKRQDVMSLSQNSGSPYIPLGTVNCFLKKTTTLNEENLQMKYWSPKDMNDYKEHIQLILKPYLP